MIIETERLLLRNWREDDIEKMAAISADPVVMEYFPSTYDLNTTKHFIEFCKNEYENNGFCLYATELKKTGEFIGFIGLTIPGFTIPNFSPKGKPIVEIGWRLSAKHWGKGYATEGAKAVLKQAFKDLKLTEVISMTAEQNVRSRNVMEKIGLKRDSQGDFNHPKIPSGHKLSKHVLYKLSQEQY